MKKQERNSNLELLRIISILLIILHHFGIHGNYKNITSIPNKFFLDFAIIGGKIGVTIFILITGYYMIENKLNLKKIIKMILEVVFYTLGITIIFKLLGITQLTNKTIFVSLTPITHNIYWFVTTYIILYLLTPFINKLLKQLNKKEYQKFIILLIIIQSIIPMVFLIESPISDLGWFILIYSVAAYIKLYPNKYFENKCLNKKITIIMYLVLYGIMIVIDYLNLKYNICLEKIDAIYYTNMNSIFILLISTCLFLWFLKIEMKSSKIINIVAKSTLGVYIIHDNPFVRKFLWQVMFKYPNDIETWKLIIVAISSVFLVFVTCVIIDQIRINTIGKLENKIIKSISKNLKLKKET